MKKFNQVIGEMGDLQRKFITDNGGSDEWTDEQKKEMERMEEVQNEASHAVKDAMKRYLETEKQY